METRVLMVCLGNICRSPLAEGAFRALVSARDQSGSYKLDSAGSGGWHVCEAPLDGSIQIAEHHGIDISSQQSRLVQGGELGDWDWIIAMDSSNLKNLLAMGAPPDRTRLLLSFIPPGYALDVPDPYYEGGFDRVFDLVNSGCEHLLKFIESEER